jgi:hypothetical protein
MEWRMPMKVLKQEGEKSQGQELESQVRILLWYLHRRQRLAKANNSKIHFRFTREDAMIKTKI